MKKMTLIVISLIVVLIAAVVLVKLLEKPEVIKYEGHYVNDNNETLTCDIQRVHEPADNEPLGYSLTTYYNGAGSVIGTCKHLMGPVSLSGCGYEDDCSSLELADVIPASERCARQAIYPKYGCR